MGSRVRSEMGLAVLGSAVGGGLGMADGAEVEGITDGVSVGLSDGIEVNLVG